MNKEALISLGLTEEQATKVMSALDGAVVPKTRFNEVNGELQTLKKTLTERDKQLEGLKKSSGDADALRGQITELQKANAEQLKAHEEQLRAVRIDSDVSAALTEAHARNHTAARALLAEFLKTAQLGEDGRVTGLREQLTQLAGAADTAFMFEAAQAAQPAQAARFTGVSAAERGDAPAASSCAMTIKMNERMNGCYPLLQDTASDF